MKTFKLLLGIALPVFCFSCGDSSHTVSYNTNAYPTTNGGGYVSTTTTNPSPSPTVSEVSDIATAESGLDLQAVADLAKRAKNAADLERLLNQPESVNNLDLDENGSVDYINVTEFKDATQNAKGYSLSVDLGEGNIQEIATILLERDNPGDKTIDVYVAGNEEIYGTDDYYAGAWNHSDSPFAVWAFGSHPYYSSSYHHGYYPSYYSPFAVVGLSGYRSKMQSYRQTSPLKSVGGILTKTHLTSPNAGKIAANIKAPLSKPTLAQQTFQKTNPSRAVRTTPTYGSSSSRSVTTSPSYSSSRSTTSPSSSSSSSRPSSSRSSSSSSSRRR